jgi:hypothetical protein
MNLNRPLHSQRQRQRRPAEAGRYKVKTVRRVFFPQALEALEVQWSVGERERCGRELLGSPAGGLPGLVIGLATELRMEIYAALETTGRTKSMRSMATATP